MLTTTLSKWTFSTSSAHAPLQLRAQEMTADVPGCVHLDLLKHDLIPDPYYDRNENQLHWIGQSNWSYRTNFALPDSYLDRDVVELVFEGLDTVASITLNGSLIGRAENMHLTHRFNIKDVIRAGENELILAFDAPLEYAERQRQRLGELPRVLATEHPYNFIRKMACNFGWDWGPVLITAGIWKPVRIEAWNSTKILSVRPLVAAADPERAVLDIYVDFALAPESTKEDPELAIELTSPSGTSIFLAAQNVSGERAHLTVEIANPELWWPRGHGPQPLYSLKVVLSSDPLSPQLLDLKTGIRSVKLNTEPDENGTAFNFEINGKRIFCKGANWIPNDCFPSRVTRERYRTRLLQAAEANMNMLRVWGGGIYESSDFYDVCDELGILVWQDFLFSCALYPEEAPFPALIEQEARQQVARLSRHPSLVLWNGNNECIWGYFDWSKGTGDTIWKDAVGDRGWGAGYYLNVLPTVVRELDPSRPYWPGSPYSGSMNLHPLNDNHGCSHLWKPWNQQDYTTFRHHTPRFVSEFGHQAPPTYATLSAALHTDQLQPESASMLHHQRANDGKAKLKARLEEHFPPTDNFDAWLYLTQVNQARAIQLAVEWFRTRQPHCSGVLYWQLNDCWPVISWSAIDSQGHPKPLWYATRRFYEDRLLTIQPHQEGLALYTVNDTDAPWSEEVELERMTFTGETCSRDAANFHTPPRSTQMVAILAESLWRARSPEAELLCAKSASRKALWFYDRDKNLHYPPASFKADLHQTSSGYILHLTAETLMRDVCLFVDRLDPEASSSNQLMTLLPGESYSFDISTKRTLTTEEVTRYPILQCVNFHSPQG